MSDLNCVDMSTYGGELTAKEAECMKDSGIELVIAGSGHPNSLGAWTEQQAGAALDAGMHLHGYRWLNLSEPIAPQMNNAFQSFGVHIIDVEMFWIDVEDVTDAGTPAEIIDAVTTAVNICVSAGIEHGIYTGGWWWRPYTENSESFKHLPLWNAYYDGDPDEDGLPYGGWEHSLIEQYQGTTDLCGQSVDLNHHKIDYPPAIPAPVEEELTLNEMVLERFELAAIVALHENHMVRFAAYCRRQQWIRQSVDEAEAPAAMAGHPDHKIVRESWEYAREQGYIPDRVSH